MARIMIGAEELAAQPARVSLPGPERLDIRSLTVSDDSGQNVVRDLSLTVRGGEIVGVAGVSGNGQHELVEALAGQRQASNGEIRISAEVFHASRAEMHRHKISCLPEEPLRNACVGRMSVAENLAFRAFDLPPFSIAGFWLRPAQFEAEAEQKIEQYRIRTRSADTPIASLSGGNVQRAVLARELGEHIEVMIAANPCFGLDFSAVAQIHAEIVAARNRGAAVLLVSSDLDEILEIADRLVVMFNGRLVHEVSVADADLAEIGRHMAGH
jgi:simple sugar transport system ATP-binding protein